MNRVTHVITSACDIRIQRVDRDTVRIRITENSPDLPDPTDLELEGDPVHISEALATAAAVLTNLDSILNGEPS